MIEVWTFSLKKMHFKMSANLTAILSQTQCVDVSSTAFQDRETVHIAENISCYAGYPHIKKYTDGIIYLNSNKHIQHRFKFKYTHSITHISIQINSFNSIHFTSNKVYMICSDTKLCLCCSWQNSTSLDVQLITGLTNCKENPGAKQIMMLLSSSFTCPCCSKSPGKFNKINKSDVKRRNTLSCLD